MMYKSNSSAKADKYPKQDKSGVKKSPPAGPSTGGLKGGIKGAVDYLESSCDRAGPPHAGPK